MHLERRHSIVLPAPVAEIFPLFTPRGETLWVKGWEPDFLHPMNGDTQDGMVFRTEHGGETTLWACCLWEPEAYRVRYVRVTPNSRFGFVEVWCREIAAGQTEATVSYAFTALSRDGEAYLADLDEEAFRRMIEDWRVSIGEWLAKAA